MAGDPEPIQDLEDEERDSGKGRTPGGSIGVLNQRDLARRRDGAKRLRLNLGRGIQRVIHWRSAGDGVHALG